MIRQSCNHAPSCIASGICQEAVMLPLAKPIRIIQLLLVAVVFALTVYTISRNTPYEKIEEIFLLVLYTSFLLITIVDIISQFSGEPIPDTPMFLFGIVGTALFLMAAFGHFFVINRTGIIKIWRLTTSVVLLTLCSLLYLLDILLIYLYGY